MNEENDPDMDQLKMGDEEAKLDLYNESNNENNSLEKDDKVFSNRFTMVDKNFDEEESRENSIGLNKLRPTSNSNLMEDIYHNDIAINNSNPTSTRVTKSSYKLSRELNLIDIKIILLGNVSVGKTSIVGRYIDNSFHNQYECTIQAANRLKVIKEDENTSLKLSIWDTAGQEKFLSMTRQYYRDAHGAIIVFDLTNRKTFDEINNWIEELQKHGSEDTVIIILGNKSDLTSERAISEDDIKDKLKNEYFYLDVSAKTGNNISLAFDKLKKLIMEKIKMKKKNKKNINGGKAQKKKLNEEGQNKKDYGIKGKDKSNKCC